jgi:hypothetical protein
VCRRRNRSPRDRVRLRRGLRIEPMRDPRRHELRVREPVRRGGLRLRVHVPWQRCEQLLLRVHPQRIDGQFRRMRGRSARPEKPPRTAPVGSLFRPRPCRPPPGPSPTAGSMKA